IIDEVRGNRRPVGGRSAARGVVIAARRQRGTARLANRVQAFAVNTTRARILDTRPRALAERNARIGCDDVLSTKAVGRIVVEGLAIRIAGIRFAGRRGPSEGLLDAFESVVGKRRAIVNDARSPLPLATGGPAEPAGDLVA